ncbi:hypothetical protein PF004_g18306 [Phytophthora fragariae]|uniref:Uncharacterized protein n=1 Tax=Phytophthora fragariae TaxID=53985 RepID=A0A6G0NCV9_9STRA|nr:hypothetical protein PF004_g18306 [Phytophthora fragariae]
MHVAGQQRERLRVVRRHLSCPSDKGCYPRCGGYSSEQYQLQLHLCKQQQFSIQQDVLKDDTWQQQQRRTQRVLQR